MIHIKRNPDGTYAYPLWLDDKLLLTQNDFKSWENVLAYLSDISAALDRPVAATNLPYMYED